MDIYGLCFNWVDGVVAGVLIFCLLLGLISGLVMQMASILSVVVGMALSFFVGPLATVVLGRWIDSQTICGLLGHTGCFFTGTLLVRLVAACFSAFLKKCKLERFDRLAGGGLGAVKGIVVCAVFIVIAGRFQVGAVKAPLEEAVTAPHIIAAADRAWSWAEEHEFGQNMNAFKESLVAKAGVLKQKGETMAVDYGKKRLLESAVEGGGGAPDVVEP